MTRSVWAVGLLMVVGGMACDADWDEPPELGDDESALSRYNAAQPPAAVRDPGRWITEHTVSCDEPVGDQLWCDEGQTVAVHLNGTPSLTEFCGRAKPLTSQLVGGVLWVNWGWCLGQAGCSPQNIVANKTMARAYLGNCEAALLNYSWSHSNVACTTGRCAWTRADVSHCGGVNATTPLTIKYI